MNHIEATIADMEKKAQGYESRAEGIRIQINALMRLFGIGEAAEPSPATKEIKATKKTRRKSGRKRKYSQYQGVTKGKPKKFAAFAQINGKHKWLGQYDIEEEAAAKAAEARGETDLARTLYNIAEQKENNPDKPGAQPVVKRRKGKRASILKSVYECDDCNYEYAKPIDTCELCGCKTFKEHKQPM